MNMLPFPSDVDPIAQAAAAWVLRLDRGLTAEEQDAFSQWLAADPRHGEALALHRWGWDELDRLAGIQDSVHAQPDPDLLRPSRPRRFQGRSWRWGLQAAGIAAVFALAATVWWTRPTSPTLPPVELSVEPSYALAAPIQERVLEDGSVVALNRGAVIETSFTPEYRLVHLLRGEANFNVVKDVDRPFVVRAGNVDVRAIGTIFNVRLGNAEVEVLVSEGRVGVRNRLEDLDEPPSYAVYQEDAAAPEPSATSLVREEVLLNANQQIVLPLTDSASGIAPTRAVATLDEQELERRLAWQPRLLDFTDAPMSSIVGEFNRRNPVRLLLAEPALGEMRLSATFRSDNVEGFLRLMESDFGLRATWRGETEVMLSRR